MIRKIYCLFLLLFFVACSDSSYILFDKSKPVMDNAWLSKDVKDYWVEAPKQAGIYRLLLNLRVSNEYKYSNLFILFRINGPKKEFQTKRLEFKLADSQGDWLGAGSGNVFTFRILITNSYTFSNQGVYKFQIEQDMRDNPLKGIIDIGLRLERRN